MPEHVPPAWVGLIDDAAIFPPGNAELSAAVQAFGERQSQWFNPLVASLVVKDTDLPALDGAPLPLSIVVTGGAGAVTGALKGAAQRGHEVRGLEIALRDLDDLAGNAQRVVQAAEAARGDGLLDEGTTLFVELPNHDPSPGWLASADVVAAADHRLKFRTGGLEISAYPTPERLAAFIDAALDRETPFKCTAGLHNAVSHSGDGLPHFGFLNVLCATEATFDGEAQPTVVQLLTTRNPADLVVDTKSYERARRWFTSFGSCSVLEPLEDLISLNLLETP